MSLWLFDDHERVVDQLWSEYVHLDTGPVAGFWVEDARSARRELIAAGVDSCTYLEFGADGHAWFDFRAPDGNFYELCEHNRFLESSEG